MADFMTELTYPQPPSWGIGEVDPHGTCMSGEGRVILISSTRQVFNSAIHFDFMATNNDVEHEALVAGLHLAMALRVCRLLIYSDFQVIVCQVKGEYEAKGEQILHY